jgi:hypothetical protein
VLWLPANQISSLRAFQAGPIVFPQLEQNGSDPPSDIGTRSERATGIIPEDQARLEDALRNNFGLGTVFDVRRVRKISNAPVRFQALY